MAILKLPELMKYYVGNKNEVALNGATVDEVVHDLVHQYPPIKVHLMDTKGNLRRHINLFINGTNIKELNGINSSLNPEDKLILLMSISGG